MATLPAQRTWTTGELVTAAMFNDDLRDAVNFFVNKPTCLVFNSAAIAIPNITTTYFTFNSEQHDNDAIHSTSVNTSRLTVATAGVYVGSASASFAGSAGGSQRSVLVRLNGTTIIRQMDIPRNGAGATVMALPLGPYKLAASDYLEMGIYQDSGAALNVTAEFGIVWESVG